MRIRSHFRPNRTYQLGTSQRVIALRQHLSAHSPALLVGPHGVLRLSPFELTRLLHSVFGTSFTSIFRNVQLRKVHFTALTLHLGTSIIPSSLALPFRLSLPSSFLSLSLSGLFRVSLIYQEFQALQSLYHSSA